MSSCVYYLTLSPPHSTLSSQKIINKRSQRVILKLIFCTLLTQFKSSQKTIKNLTRYFCKVYCFFSEIVLQQTADAKQMQNIIHACIIFTSLYLISY